MHKDAALHIELSNLAHHLGVIPDQLAMTADQSAMTADQLAATADQLSTTADQLAMTADQLAMTADQSATTADQLSTTADQLAMTADPLAVAVFWSYLRGKERPKGFGEICGAAHWAHGLAVHKHQLGRAVVQHLALFVQYLVKKIDPCPRHGGNSGHYGYQLIVAGGPAVLALHFHYWHHHTLLFHLGIAQSESTHGLYPSYFIILRIIAVIDIAHAVYFRIAHSDGGPMFKHEAKVDFAPCLFNSTWTYLLPCDHDAIFDFRTLPSLFVRRQHSAL
jgi:hypothetical protein